MAGAALLIDYTLAVAVSVSAGVAKGALLFRKNVVVTDVPYHLTR